MACARSCIRPLRIMHAAQEPATMPSLHRYQRTHPHGGSWRQCQCPACEGYFPEHHGTIFHGKQVAVELIVHVLACLAEGLGIRATARVFEVTPNSVLHWLGEAAAHLTALSRYFLCDMHVK